MGHLVGAWLILMAPMAAAQEVDGRWAPWIGCWRAVDETETAPLLCVVPLAGEPGIEMLTVVDGQVVARESLVADGQEHPVSRDECEGWERAEFSGDARRIYVGSELRCGTDAPRSSTGVMSMVTPFEWLDVRTIDVDGESVPWALRYRLASRADFQAAGQGDLVAAQGSEARMARVAASAPITIDDVIDATGRVSAETVELWVVERGERFALDASRLIDLADAGVPPSVIDVVVAVSYPEQFVVNDARTVGRSSEAGRGRYARRLDPFVDPFYDPYSRYGYYSGYGSPFRYGLDYYGRYGYGGYGFGYGGYGYSRYGYGGFGFGRYNNGYGGFGNGIIVVERRGSGDAGSRDGRVVRGGGYTSATGSGGSTGRSARPRSSGSARSTAPAARPAPSRSSGSGTRSAAPARRSSGSAPRSTGRSAQPRAGRGR